MREWEPSAVFKSPSFVHYSDDDDDVVGCSAFEGAAAAACIPCTLDAPKAAIQSIQHVRPPKSTG